MQLLDQQAKAAANATATQQRVKQEQRRTPEHRQHIDAGVAEAAHSFY
jgi:hypothetical protein